MTTNNNLLDVSPSEFYQILLHHEKNKPVKKPQLKRQTNMPPGLLFPAEDLIAEWLPTEIITASEIFQVKCREKNCNAMVCPEEDETCFDCYSKHMRECQEDPGDIPERYRNNSF
jgi:hypothetical protein